MQKILIVDDDSTLRAALTRHLENRGFLVQCAASGLEGFESFTEDTPDLIVSDVVLCQRWTALSYAPECGKVEQAS